MNTKILLATLAIAAAASGVARADDADPSGQFAVKVESSRTRAEVAAEAVQALRSGKIPSGEASR